MSLKCTGLSRVFFPDFRMFWTGLCRQFYSFTSIADLCDALLHQWSHALKWTTTIQTFLGVLETSDSRLELCQSLGKVAKCLLCLLSHKRKEREQLFRSVQTKPSLGVAGALDVACTGPVLSSFQHQRPHRVLCFLCSSRGVEGSDLCVQCGLWLDFCLVCTRAEKHASCSH